MQQEEKTDTIRQDHNYYPISGTISIGSSSSATTIPVGTTPYSLNRNYYNNNAISTNNTCVRSTNSRRQTTIQLRKVRQEERIRRKRGIPLTLLPTQQQKLDNDTTIATIETAEETLRTLLTEYCTTPIQQQQQQRVNRIKSLYGILTTTGATTTTTAPKSSSLHRNASSIVHTTIEQLIRTNPILYGYQLIQNLMMQLHQEHKQHDEMEMEMIATILVEITSIQFSNTTSTATFSTTSTSSMMKDDDHDDDTGYDYYGPTTIIGGGKHQHLNEQQMQHLTHIQPQWYEFFVIGDDNNNQIPVSVVSQSYNNNNNNNNSSDHRWKYNYIPILFQIIQNEQSSNRLVELVCNVIGNLVIGNYDDDHHSNTASVTTVGTVSSSHQQKQVGIRFMEELLSPPSMSHWSILISKLPLSSYCCSCILRVDTIHYAMDFIRPIFQLHRQQQEGQTFMKESTTLDSESKIIMNLFSPLLDVVPTTYEHSSITTTTTAVTTSIEIMWMIESLTRREVDAIYVLLFSYGMDPLLPKMQQIQSTFPPDSCCHIMENDDTPTIITSTTTRTTPPLLLCIYEQIMHHAKRLSFIDHGSIGIASNDSSKAFLVPALRTVGNIVVGLQNDTTNLYDLVQNPIFVHSIHTLFEYQIMMMDTIYTVYDVLASTMSTIKNIETNTLHGDDVRVSLVYSVLSNFLPNLVRVITNPSSRIEWKRECIICIVDVVGMSTDSRFDIDQQRVIVQDIIWKSAIIQKIEHHHNHNSSFMLIQALLDMIQLSDTDIIIATMKLLHRILSTIDDSRMIFMNLDGIDILERICSVTDGSIDENTQELAVNLLDVYFDRDHDEDDNGDQNYEIPTNNFRFNDSFVNPATTTNGTFDFGISSNTTIIQPTTTIETTTATISMGRGRGRVLPAWMSQS